MVVVEVEVEVVAAVLLLVSFEPIFAEPFELFDRMGRMKRFCWGVRRRMLRR